MASTVTTRQKARAASAATTETGKPRNLKRKSSSSDEDDDAEGSLKQPRKMPAIGVNRPNRPLQPSTMALNASTPAPNNPTALPMPQVKSRIVPPTLAKSTATGLGKSTRGASAPPPPSTARVHARPTTRSIANGAGPSSTAAAGGPKRIVSGPSRARPPGAHAASTSTSRPGLTSSSDKRFTQLQTQLEQLESARVADSTRLFSDMEAERTKVAELQANHAALSRELVQAKTDELSQRRELVLASDEIEKLRKAHAKEVMELEMELRRREREVRETSEDLRVCNSDLEREREQVGLLKGSVASQATAQIALTSQNTALQAQVSALQTQVDDYARTISEMRIKLEESDREVAELKLQAMESEMIRRKLHNTVQELKGNIRVFCRVRPVLISDVIGLAEGNTRMTKDEFGQLREQVQAHITFPDRMHKKEIVLHSSSESATGQERKEVYNFGFDRVFEPESTQAEVFEEISQLAQSCTDGYNVCIFAYGQTGSGKSFTMEGGSTETAAGMIPRAVEQVFRVADFMKTKGWEYKMEGQFLEIYNETIHDLLAPVNSNSSSEKKHEIKHDPKTGSTRVTDVTVVPLTSASQVKNLLALAQSRRSVAATLVNERSSRSHSVFTLRITGTGERCEGTLNLVDLAGSERLNVSFAPGAVADKERVRETQNINKSLSALGDVIAALGERGERGGEGSNNKHIPYRNSKAGGLTYLLQNSLSGNSKTLMVLNLSPLATHLQESLTSLRFATKVNNTTIGTAKKQIKMSSSS
ncbi:kinesin domain containing protein [Amanita muscaria]